MKPVALVADLEFYPEDSVSKLKTRFDVIASTAKNAHELSEELGKSNARVFFCGLGIYVGEDLLENVKSLKSLVSPATGINHLDLNYLNSRKILVIKLGDSKDQIQNVFATAELAWGLVIACARRMNLAVDSVKEENFDRTLFLGRELLARTLGVVGFGRLGRQVAKYGSAFGMNVVVYETDSAQHNEIAPFQKVDSLEELLNISDVVSVHIPFNDKNKNCIDAAMISKIKHGAIFINTSRGELVDEQALAMAVRSGQLFGVGVDVLSKESEDGFSVSNSPLASAMRDGLNVIVTPHIGGWAHDAVATTRAFVVDEFLRRCEP